MNGPIHRRPSSVPQINFAYGTPRFPPSLSRFLPPSQRASPRLACYNDRLTASRHTTATFHRQGRRVTGEIGFRASIARVFYRLMNYISRRPASRTREGTEFIALFVRALFLISSRRGIATRGDRDVFSVRSRPTRSRHPYRWN